MANDINYGVLESIMLPQTQALQALAMRPQKSLQETNTISNTVPYALQDMLNARNTISNSTNELEQVLKLRESPWYATLKALGEVRGSSEPGKWLESGLRGLSTGYTTLDDIKAENAKLLRDARVEDLTQRLAYDKAMGEKQTQYQHQDIDYKEMPWGGAGGKNGSQSTQQIPVLNPEYWDQMISNFDEGRKTEAAYRNMSQARRNIRNKTMIMGTPEENYARDQFAAAKGREFLPLARNALKGAGQITDFEDKKYTDWLNKVQDPVQLKDTAVRIVDDVALKNGWSKEQKAQGLEMLGLTSKAENLLSQQKQYEPERVKSTNVNTEDILKKFGAKRLD